MAEVVLKRGTDGSIQWLYACPSTLRHLPFVGIDDFTFKKCFTYVTLFIDLQTHKPIDVLNTREIVNVTDWLQKYPEIELITRDGSKMYAAAVTKASPAILQVGDRWHLLHQLFEDFKKSIFSILLVKWASPSQNKLIAQKEEVDVPLYKSEAQRTRNKEKRWTRIQQVHSLFKEGYSKAAIQHKFNLSNGTVYSNLRQAEMPNHQWASPFKRFHSFIRSFVQEE